MFVVFYPCLTTVMIEFFSVVCNTMIICRQTDIIGAASDHRQTIVRPASALLQEHVCVESDTRQPWVRRWSDEWLPPVRRWLDDLQNSQLDCSQ